MNHVLELLQTVNTLNEKVRTIQTQIVVLQRDNQLLHTQLAENARSIETSVESDEAVHPTAPIQIQSPAETPNESECENEMGAIFELPKRQQKKIKRKRRKESEMNGNTLNESRKLRIAPEYQQNRDGQSQTQPQTTTLSHIYIGGLHCETVDLDVKLHLDEMGINDSKVQNLSNDNTDRPNDWKSFKISVPSEQIDQVMCEDNWPAGVRTRTFHPKRTNQSFRQYGLRHNANGDNNRPTNHADGMRERRRPNIRAWHNDESRQETYNAQRDNNIRRRTYRYEQPSQDGEYGDERTRPNTRAWHNDENRRETYNAQRDNNIRRRTYRYEQPSQDGEFGDERTRPNKRAWHNDESRRETYNAQRDINIRRRTYRYEQPSQDGEYGDERTRPNTRAWHNDENRRETYNAQRDNNIRRRTYRYEQPSQDGEYCDERTRPNKHAWHNDESRRETYNAQRDNNIRRRTYR